MSKQSNVGDRRVYEAGDQRNISHKEQKQQKAEQRYDEGNKNAHSVMDSKDERTIANRLAAAESANKSSHNASGETSDDPRNAALLHGNEPSRGAKIDAELKAEDEAILAKKAGKTDSLPGKRL